MTREEAIDVLKAYLMFDKSSQQVAKALDMAIEALSERPKGEWIDRGHYQVDEDAYEIATCSHCNAEITLEYPYDNYCPNCGTLMGGDTK